MTQSIRAMVSAAALVIAPAVLAEVSALGPQPAPSPTGCDHKGVAVHTFYGRINDLQRYLNDLSAQAVSSRLQIMVVETMKGTAQVHVFEQSEGRSYTVSSWQGEAVSNLRSEWDDKILRSRGSSCAGMDLKADLEQRGMPLVAKGSVEHVSAATTFFPMVNQETGYMRVTLYHPCD